MQLESESLRDLVLVLLARTLVGLNSRPARDFFIEDFKSTLNLLK